MNLVKAHAFGNDFLLVEEGELAGGDPPALARAVCNRHRGIGADGLMIFRMTPHGAAMQLLNADGSASEISGNGLRCLAAWVAHERQLEEITIDTDAGSKVLQTLGQQGNRHTFRAAMGHPEHVREETIVVSGAPVEAITLRVGNPQCVVLGEVSVARLHSLASALSVHPRFPAGTNVELAAVESADDVRILIWERGVGPTEASGTGACAAAVAAMSFAGAARDVRVTSPGGTQRVEWREDGLYLTGWAELVAALRWMGGAAAS